MPLVSLVTVADARIEALLDRAFGTDRRGKTAYRVREGLTAIPELSVAMVDDSGTLLGSIQSWPVQLLGDDGTTTPMVMVGPVAVDPDIQRGGIGRTLTDHLLAAAGTSAIAGTDALMLVGDPEYYARFFGFSAKRTGQWRLPGPFEPRRLLARGLGVPDRAGIVAPRPLP